MEGRLTLSDSLLMVKLNHRVGTVRLDVGFALTQPWTVLFGPSGSGKTTVLRAIAGFVRPDEGRVAQDNVVLMDSASGVFVPAHLRPVRSAAQTACLFPHMTVLRNVLYGSGWNSKPADESQLAEEVLALFRVDRLSARLPRELSGGERQRVSVARAAVSAVTYLGHGNGLLLLDEPFSGLDVALRDELLSSLREWLVRWKIPVLSVTHDVGEAFQLGAEVIKIADGAVVRQGPVGAVLSEERRRLLEQLGS
ncbi:ATP-binding cassette domain-containing protein [Edaphobacter bradus]|uniref:ATP-binding cassette domain-containing protein n=1 Tax=Edaphobacter bradus TaxID=2259016 RepID=UPI0021DFEF22|nr:ATP-binding cassette domain-containing protein [Edaphobacter bradus]